MYWNPIGWMEGPMTCWPVKKSVFCDITKGWSLGQCGFKYKRRYKKVSLCISRQKKWRRSSPRRWCKSAVRPFHDFVTLSELSPSILSIDGTPVVFFCFFFKKPCPASVRVCARLLVLGTPVAAARHPRVLRHLLCSLRGTHTTVPPNAKAIHKHWSDEKLGQPRRF